MALRANVQQYIALAAILLAVGASVGACGTTRTIVEKVEVPATTATTLSRRLRQRLP
jgi:hypothetical protein